MSHTEAALCVFSDDDDDVPLGSLFAPRTFINSSNGTGAGAGAAPETLGLFGRFGRRLLARSYAKGEKVTAYSTKSAAVAASAKSSSSSTDTAVAASAKSSSSSTDTAVAASAKSSSSSTDTAVAASAKSSSSSTDTAVAASAKSSSKKRKRASSPVFTPLTTFQECWEWWIAHATHRSLQCGAATYKQFRVQFAHSHNRSKMTMNWSKAEEECEHQHEAFCGMVNEYYQKELHSKKERKSERSVITATKRDQRNAFKSNWKAITAFLQKPDALLWATFSPVVGWSMGNNHRGSGPCGTNFWYPTLASSQPGQAPLQPWDANLESENLKTVPNANWKCVVKPIRLTVPVPKVDLKEGPVNLNRLEFQVVQKTPLPITFLTAPPSHHQTSEYAHVTKWVQGSIDNQQSLKLSAFPALPKLIWTPFNLTLMTELVLEEGGLTYRYTDQYGAGQAWPQYRMVVAEADGGIGYRYTDAYHNRTSVRVTVDLLRCALIESVSTALPALPIVLAKMIGEYT